MLTNKNKLNFLEQRRKDMKESSNYRSTVAENTPIVNINSSKAIRSPIRSPIMIKEISDVDMASSQELEETKPVLVIKKREIIPSKTTLNFMPDPLIEK